MEELYLIYVHKIGADCQDKYYYEFIFSDSVDNVDGEEWDSYPASGNPQPPYANFMNKIGYIESDFKLEVVQNNELFSMYDSMDGVIPLAWQNIDGLDEYPDKRITFPFGITIKEVEDRLYEKDVEMEFKTIESDE